MLKRNKTKKIRGVLKKIVLFKKASFFSENKKTYHCFLKSDLENIEFEKAKTKVKEQKAKRNKILNITLLVVNFLIVTGFIIYYASTSGIKKFSELIYLDVKYIFLILAVLMLLLIIIFESLKLYQLIRHSTRKKRFWLAIKSHMVGRYYDTITPFAIGGQPFQALYLNQHDIKGDVATSIPLAKQIFSNISFFIIGLVVLIANIFYPITNNVLIIIMATIGLISNGTIIFLALLFSINKRIGAGLVVFILKLLNKLHIVKNYKQTFFKVNKFVLNYQKCIKSFSKNIFIFISQILLSLFSYLCSWLIVYFLYLAFLPLHVGESVNLLNVIGCLTFCDLCSSIMPLPSGTGLAEFSFDALFKNWFAPSVFPWALFIWRTLTCFVYIFVGVIQTVCTYIKKTRNNKKNTLK